MCHGAIPLGKRRSRNLGHSGAFFWHAERQSSMITCGLCGNEGRWWISRHRDGRGELYRVYQCCYPSSLDALVVLARRGGKATVERARTVDPRQFVRLKVRPAGGCSAWLDV
jgi:hypothetical protein